VCAALFRTLLKREQFGRFQRPDTTLPVKGETNRFSG
jgi:hypothetical protein